MVEALLAEPEAHKVAVAVEDGERLSLFEYMGKLIDGARRGMDVEFVFESGRFVQRAPPYAAASDGLMG